MIACPVGLQYEADVHQAHPAEGHRRGGLEEGGVEGARRRGPVVATGRHRRPAPMRIAAGEAGDDEARGVPRRREREGGGIPAARPRRS